MSTTPFSQPLHRSCLAVLALFGLLAATSVSAGPLANLATSIDAPSIGEEVALEKPIGFQFGTLTPGPGTKVYRLMAGKQACGLLWRERPASSFGWTRNYTSWPRNWQTALAA